MSRASYARRKRDADPAPVIAPTVGGCTREELIVLAWVAMLANSAIGLAKGETIAGYAVKEADELLAVVAEARRHQL